MAISELDVALAVDKSFDDCGYRACYKYLAKRQLRNINIETLLLALIHKVKHQSWHYISRRHYKSLVNGLQDTPGVRERLFEYTDVNKYERDDNDGEWYHLMFEFYHGEYMNNFPPKREWQFVYNLNNKLVTWFDDVIVEPGMLYYSYCNTNLTNKIYNFARCGYVHIKECDSDLIKNVFQELKPLGFPEDDTFNIIEEYSNHWKRESGIKYLSEKPNDNS